MAFFIMRLCCWLMVKLMSPGSSPPHHVLLCRAAFQLVIPSVYWWMGLFLPRCSTLCFVEFHKVEPLEEPLNGSVAICSISHSSQCHTGCGCTLPYRPGFYSRLNCIGPSINRINPWDAPLVTDLQLDFMPVMIIFWAQLLTFSSSHCPLI